MHSSSFPCVLHILPISSSFTSSLKLYLAKSTSYEALHYAVSSNLQSLHLCSVQIFASANCSKTKTSKRNNQVCFVANTSTKQLVHSGKHVCILPVKQKNWQACNTESCAVAGGKWWHDLAGLVASGTGRIKSYYSINSMEWIPFQLVKNFIQHFIEHEC
jgi:hypothetical protein